MEAPKRSRQQAVPFWVISSDSSRRLPAGVTGQLQSGTPLASSITCSLGGTSSRAERGRMAATSDTQRVGGEDVIERADSLVDMAMSVLLGCGKDGE